MKTKPNETKLGPCVYEDGAIVEAETGHIYASVYEDSLLSGPLFAAAPELLEACETAQADCDAAASCIADGNLAGVADGLAAVAAMLRTAIAKAKGTL